MLVNSQHGLELNALLVLWLHALIEALELMITMWVQLWKFKAGATFK
jgi:hypothetical protein